MANSALVSAGSTVVGRAAKGPPTGDRLGDGPGRGATPAASSEKLPTASMEDLAGIWEAQGLSRDAIHTLLASWAPSTLKQYNSVLKAWTAFTSSNKLPQLPTTVSLCNFLALLARKGLSYSSVASHRAALVTFFEQVRPGGLGSDSCVTRFMKGQFRKNPPKPKYSDTWDVNTVLNYIKGQGSNKTLSLRSLTLKLVFLLAICSPKRVSELAALSIEHLQRSSEKWTFFLDYRNKNRSTGAAHTAQYEAFLEDPLLCPVLALSDYLKATEKFRRGQNRLLLSYVRFSPVQASTVARWIKEVLTSAGIADHFMAHSTRSASTSKALISGAAINDIISAACWSEKSNTFYRFYNKEVAKPSFQTHVLSR